MTDNKFTIELGIDRSEGQKASAEAVAEFREMEQAAKKSADIQEDALNEVAKAVREVRKAVEDAKKSAVQSSKDEQKAIHDTADAHREMLKAIRDESMALQKSKDDAKAAEKAKRDAVKATSDAQKREAREAAEAEKQARREAADAAQQAARDSAVSFAMVQRGLDLALDTLRAFPDAYDKAAQARKQYTQGFVDVRDELRELATIENTKATDQYTLGIMGKARDAGMSTDEYIGFRKALQGSGQQFVGTNISKEESEQYIAQAASLASARHLNPETAGDLAGALLGFTNYQKKYGQGASEAVAGYLNTAYEVTGAGKGTDRENADQVSRILSAAANEDALKGVFTRPEDVDIAESLMAEFEPGRAFQMVMMASRGLQGANPKSEGILKKAGITPMTPFLQGIEQLAPVVQEEAARTKKPLNSVLLENFGDVETARALGVAINRGVYGGVIDQRRRVAAENQGYAPVQAQVEDFRASKAFQQRYLDADQALAESRRGQKTEDVEMLHKVALRNLTASGVLNSSNDNIRKYMMNALSFGALSDQDRMQVEQESVRILEAQARAKGFDFSGQTPAAGTLEGAMAFGPFASNRSGTANVGLGFGDYRILTSDAESPETMGQRYKQYFRNAGAKGVDALADIIAHQGYSEQQGNGGGEAVAVLKSIDAKIGKKPVVLTHPTPGGGRPQVNR